VASSSSIDIPLFLAPAFQTSRQTKLEFSTTSQRRSKIGRSPLAIPPEVSFRVLEPPAISQATRMSRTQQSTVIEVEGPKGMLSMSMPAYMTLQPDESKQAHVLSILDQEDRKQREMWGGS